MISFATRFRLLLQPELQIIRFGVFAALVLVMYRSLYRLTLTHGTDWVGRENGPVEASSALRCFGVIEINWSRMRRG
jgi:hypothetical protein